LEKVKGTSSNWGKFFKKEATKPPEANPVSPPSSSELPGDRLILKPRSVSAAAHPDPALQAALEEAVKAMGVEKVSISLLDLNTGRSASVGGDAFISSASIIKLPVMVEAFRQAEQGMISLDDTVILSGSNDTDTWMPVLQTGDEVSVRRLVELMITQSDNVATNTLVDLLGRKNINATMKQLGLKETALVSKLSGGEITVDDPDRLEGRNQTCADDVVKLLSRIDEGSLVSQKASREMKAILGGQKDNDKIPAGLPSDAKVYHKTGETSQCTHDVGIVEADGKRYVLAVLTAQSPGGDAYARIGELTRKMQEAL
jgi:beta-lactamase class A